jgi:SAM-dependent methyltransferase
MTKSLDLGCGENIRNEFNADELYGVDISGNETNNIKIADLAIDPIPFEDNYFDFVTAFDFLEHIPRVLYLERKLKNPFIEVMNEIHRVLKPGGVFLGATPAFPYPQTYQDPTHVNVITDYTVQYFVENGQSLKLGRQYGFKGKFELMGQGWHPTINYWLMWQLRSIK